MLDKENIFELSDEDFLKELDKGISEDKQEPVEPVKDVESEPNKETDTDTDTEKDIVESEDKVIPKEPTEKEPEVSIDTEVEPVTKTEEVNTPDIETEYKKIMAPFKANGIQMQAKNTDDAIALMQMGANYHKKMVGLKPNLKIIKLLENNNLLDESKINYLIDLNNKNPKAITKLIQDSKIDVDKIDTEKKVEYTPPSQSVSDTEIELDNVLKDIESTPSYSKTLNVVTQEWDDNSRNIIAENPHIISVINEQIGNGIFDAVNGAVIYERSLGRLKGISDLEAYKQIGDTLYAQGKLPGQKPISPKTISKSTTSITEEQRKAKKKAASPTKGKKTSTTKTYNPLAMSDEEFEKITNKTFI